MSNKNEKKYPIQYNSEYYVVSANDLIRGKQKMSLREAQLLFIAISQVVKEDKALKTFTTTVPELAKFMGIDENSLYRDLENICIHLLQRIVKIQIGKGKNGKAKKWKAFQWVNSAEYDSGRLTLRLSDDIKPYLLDLNAYYTQNMLGVLMTFESYYAVRLYQYLYAEYKEKHEKATDWTFTVEEIRDLFQIKTNQYKSNRDLIKYTIKQALIELDKSDFACVSEYSENKAHQRGTPIVSVSFKIAFFKNKEEKEKKMS